MDNITSTLISQLLDKALENTQPEERLAFVEKLFAQLPPAGQQEFLLSLTRLSLETGTCTTEQKAASETDESRTKAGQVHPSKPGGFCPRADLLPGANRVCQVARNGRSTSGKIAHRCSTGWQMKRGSGSSSCFQRVSSRWTSWWNSWASPSPPPRITCGCSRKPI